MNDKNEIIISIENIKNFLNLIRGQQVMLDIDLTKIYGYELKAMNQQVKRNIERFPEDFMFQLTKDEVELVKSQIVTSRDNTFFLGKKVVVENYHTPLQNKVFTCWPRCLRANWQRNKAYSLCEHLKKCVI